MIYLTTRGNYESFIFKHALLLFDISLVGQSIGDSFKDSTEPTLS